jgi:hypothetical protein
VNIRRPFPPLPAASGPLAARRGGEVRLQEEILAEA